MTEVRPLELTVASAADAAQQGHADAGDGRPDPRTDPRTDPRPEVSNPIDRVDPELALARAAELPRGSAPPRLVRWTFRLRGVLDLQQARRLERRLAHVRSLDEVRVDPSLDRLVVSGVDVPYDPAFIAALAAEESVAAVFQPLGQAGDRGAAGSADPSPRTSTLAGSREVARRSLAVSGLVLAAALLSALGSSLDLGLGNIPLDVAAIGSLALLGWAARPVVLHTLQSALRGRPTAETLPVLLAAALIVVALSRFLAGGRPGFVAPVLLLAGTIAVGSWLKGRRTELMHPARAIRDLVPLSAWVARPDGIYSLPAESLQSGELVIVRAGMSAPGDGVVVGGEAILDARRVLVGQKSRKCVVGDTIYVGRRIIDGTLALRLQAHALDASAARIARLVERSGAADPWLASRASVAGWRAFGLGLALAALAAALVWWRGGRASGFDQLIFGAPGQAALAVLMAQPVVAAAWGPLIAWPDRIARALAEGVLVRDARSLHRAGLLHDVVFDASGTVTRGQPSVRGHALAEGTDPQRVFAWLLALTSGDAHPDSMALARYARESAPQSSSAVALTTRELRPGLGLSARLGSGASLLLGNSGLMADAGLDPDARRHPWMTPLRGALETDAGNRVYLAHAGRLLARFDLVDSLRPEAAQVVRRLRAQGLRVALVSGDGDESLEATGRALGISEVRGGLASASIDAWLAATRRTRRGKARARGRHHVAVVSGSTAEGTEVQPDRLSIRFGTGLAIGGLTDDVTILPDDLERLLLLRALSSEARSRLRLVGWTVVAQQLLVAAAAVAGLLSLEVAALAGAALSVVVAPLAEMGSAGRRRTRPG